MTPSHVERLIKYNHKLEGALPIFDFKQAKFVAKALGIKGTHPMCGGYHPGEDEFVLVEAINEYNYRRIKWEKQFGTGTSIAVPTDGSTTRS